MLEEKWRILVSVGFFVGFILVLGWMYRFPTSDYIPSFSLVKGIPNGHAYSYTGPPQLSIQVCRNDPRCVGISPQELFYSTTIMPRGSTVYTHDRNQISYVKDSYPTIFM